MGYLYLLLALSLAISSLGWVRIVDAKIVKSASIENKEARDLLDAEALRIVNSMPRWKPARDNKGKKFGLGAELIIDFRLGKNEVPVTVIEESGLGCIYHVTIWQEPRKMRSMDRISFNTWPLD